MRQLAPDGVNAIFDHLGGPSFRRSFDLLAHGGTLVADGTATQLNGGATIATAVRDTAKAERVRAELMASRPTGNPLTAKAGP